MGLAPPQPSSRPEGRRHPQARCWLSPRQSEHHRTRSTPSTHPRPSCGHALRCSPGLGIRQTSTDAASLTGCGETPVHWDPRVKGKVLPAAMLSDGAYVAQKVLGDLRSHMACFPETVAEPQSQTFSLGQWGNRVVRRKPVPPLRMAAVPVFTDRYPEAQRGKPAHPRSHRGPAGGAEGPGNSGTDGAG